MKFDSFFFFRLLIFALGFELVWGTAFEEGATSRTLRAQTVEESAAQSEVAAQNETAVAANVPTDVERLNAVIDRYLEGFTAFSPIMATWVGDYRYDSEMDDLSDDARERERAFYRAILDDLRQIDVSRLDVRQKIDKEMLELAAQKALWYSETLREWEWNPVFYSTLTGNSIYFLMAREFAPLKDRLLAVTARLERLPVFLEQVRANLKPERVPEIHAQTAIKQNKGLFDVLDEFVRPNRNVLSESERERLEKATNVARQAAEEHQIWLENVLLPRCKGDFRIGEKLFDEKLYFSLGTKTTRRELRERALRALDESRNEMYALSQTIYLKEYPETKFPDSPSEAYKQAIIRAALEVAYRDVPQRDRLVEEAKRSLESATAFVREKDILTLPDEPIDVIIMPEFLRGVSVAYCDAPGPMDVGQKTFYAVMPIPDDWTDEQTDSFLREYNRRSLQELTIHEAMPGHYAQLALSNRYPSRLRRVLGSETFIEGWAIYAEKQMASLGYYNDDPLMKLINLKWDVRTISNTLLDQGVHVDGTTREEAMYLMTELAFQEEREAAGKWDRACLTSTQLSTYFVGMTEMFALREEAEKRLGDRFNLKEFHDKLLRFGSPAPAYMRELLFND